MASREVTPAHAEGGDETDGPISEMERNHARGTMNMNYNMHDRRKYGTISTY